MAALDDANRLVHDVYARWLDAGTKLGFILLIGGFVAYAFGITTPYVPFERLPALWSLPVDQFNAATHAPTGWQWVQQWWHSDYLTYFGVVALLLTTIASMLRTMLVLYALGERLHASIALLQVLVLAAAATGVVSAH
jgi:hypothetical protein